MWGPIQVPQSKVEGEARVEGVKRLRIEGEARTEIEVQEKLEGEGSCEVYIDFIIELGRMSAKD